MGGRRGFLRVLLRLTGPALLVAVVWSLDDKTALWQAVRDANWPLLLAAAALNVPVIHLKVLRWQGFVAVRGYRYPLRQAYAAVLSSLYLGMLTPGRVGDALRIQYARRQIALPYAEGIGTTLMDRICDLYVLAAVAALGVVHFAPVLRGDLAALTWVAVGVALTLPLVLVLRSPGELLKRALRRVSDKWHASIDSLLQSVRSLVRPSLSFAIPLTIAAFALNYVQGWLVARSIGLDLSYLDVAGLLAATSLLGLMPISISGVGVRELFLALVFPALGLSAAQGVAFGILVFVVINLVTVALGMVAWQLSPPPFDIDGFREDGVDAP